MAWSDSLTDEERGYVANKGWDKLDPEKAAQSIVQSYRNLERSRPEPPPKEYIFEGLTAKPEILERAKTIATELKLPQAAAITLAQRLATEATTAETTVAEAEAKRVADSVAALDKAWGADKDKNTEIAGRAFTALGLPKETVDALVSTLGVDKVMTMGHDLGTKMGEATILRGGTTLENKQDAALTRETALVERNKLMQDKEWFTKWQAGEPEAVKRFNDVTTAILGDPNGQWSAPPENFGRRGDGQGTEIFKGSQKWQD